MLAFIIPLRNPHNSTDYDHVESILRDTLASLTQQSCDDYIVIIVGNRHPAFPLPERVVFVGVDFPPPSDIKGPQTGPGAAIWDKGTKNAVGLVAARAFEPEYVMFVDADDFVHREVAAYAHARPGHDGWLVDRGWVYSRARNAYAPRRKFFMMCGTSFIVAFEAYEVPPELTVSATQREIAEAFGERLENILEHGYAYDWWKEHGRHLEPLPFSAAVYQVDTGENHSGNVLVGPALPYRSHLNRDFAIRPSKGRARTLWSSVGAAAFKPDPAFRDRRQEVKETKRRVSHLEGYSPPSDSGSQQPRQKEI